MMVAGTQGEIRASKAKAVVSRSQAFASKMTAARWAAQDYLQKPEAATKNAALRSVRLAGVDLHEMQDRSEKLPRLQPVLRRLDDVYQSESAKILMALQSRNPRSLNSTPDTDPSAVAGSVEDQAKTELEIASRRAPYDRWEGLAFCAVGTGAYLYLLWKILTKRNVQRTPATSAPAP
jgi:hypothetical protein